MKQVTVRSLVHWPMAIVVLLVTSALADTIDLSAPVHDYPTSAGGHKADPIQAAINTMYNLEVRKISTKSEPIPTQKVEIESNQIPLLIHFKSQSSKLKVIQSHKGGIGETQKSHSEDEPDILIHEVKKPIYQQVKEIIVPYRKTIQEIRPVSEEMQTIVARANFRGHPQSYQKDEPAHIEHDRMMPPPPHSRGGHPYMKDVEKFIIGDDESERANYLPQPKKDMYHQEANMVSLEFEDPAKGKNTPMSAASMMSNGQFVNAPQTQQLPFGVPIAKTRLARRQPNRQDVQSTPAATIQRRMLMAPSRLTQMILANKQPPKRKWKIIYLPRY